MSKKLPFGRASRAAMVGTLSLALMVGAGNLALATDVSEANAPVADDKSVADSNSKTSENDVLGGEKNANEPAAVTEAPKNETSAKPIPAGRTSFFAAGGPINASVELASDGTASFDGDDTAGNDSSANNGIVRVNDTFVYRINYQTGSDPVKNFTTKIVLPKGVTLAELPGICKAEGSSLEPQDPFAGVTFPLTANALDQMAQQTVTCNLGDVDGGASLNYGFSVKLSNLAPQGHKLTPASFSYKADGIAEEVVNANLPSVTASSKLKWDVSKNTFQTTPDTGYVSTPVFAPCPWDTKQSCFRVTHSVMLMAPNGGKGIMPGIGDVTLVDDLSPESLYPELTPEQHQQIKANIDKYGARIYPAINNFGIAGSKVGVSENGIQLDATNAVIDSGTMKIDGQANGGSQPGKEVTLTFENPDLSLRTSPTMTARSGVPLDVSKGYAISRAFYVYTPVATTKDFGTPNPKDPESKSLKSVNKFKNLRVQGFTDADVQNGDANPTNDYRSTTFNISVTGSVSKYFAGVVGVENNTPPEQFVSSDKWRGEGLPGGGTYRDGQQTVAPTQEVVSIIRFTGPNPAVDVTDSMVVCDSWDNSKLYLKKKNWLGTTYLDKPRPTGWGRGVPSEGEAVWITGYDNVANPEGTNSMDATMKSQVPTIKVQYSALPGGSSTDYGNNHVSACGNDKGPWFDDPAAVPGNDPAKAAEGVYTGVGRVRIFVVLPPAVGKFEGLGYGTRTNFAVGMEVAPDLKPGTVIPNWASMKRVTRTDGTSYTLDEVLADPKVNWNSSTYNPGEVASDTFNGVLGDRLIVGDVQVRIDKKVRKGEAGEFTSTPPQVSGGDIVQYQLSPSLTSNATKLPGNTAPVWIEDCLPGASAFVSSVPEPTIVSTDGVPADAKLANKCKPGDTYIRWEFPNAEINGKWKPINVTTEVLDIAKTGSYANKVEIWAEGDQSPVSLRTSEATISITNPAGMKLAKIALTPVLQVNPAGAQNRDIHKWRVLLVNNNEPSAAAVSDPIVIDVLPKRGTNGSAYDGDFNFVSATAKSGEKILYTKADSASIHVHGSDASNLPGGTTTWCDAAVNGNPVIDNGGGCPASLTEVTGLYVKREGAFSVGQSVEFEVAMEGIANKKAEEYINTVGASAQGLTFPVGPINRKETTIAASIGDRFFIDANGNGLYEDGEPAVAGADVRVTGTDDLGNPVDVTVQTKADGTYLVPSLRASDAAGYKVTFTIPADKVAEKYEFTTTKVGTDTTIDSDPDGAGVVTNVVLKPGEARTDIDAGIVKPAIELVKTADKDEVRAGDVVKYTFTATNTGTAVLHNVALTEEAFTNGFGQPITLDAAPVVDTAASTGTVDAMAPGQKIVWTANYTVKASDLELGTTIDNTAKVTGVSPRDTPVTATAEKKLPPVDDGTYKVSKTSDPASGTAVVPGQKVTYTVKVSHVGNLRVTNASLEDDLAAVLTDADYNNDAVVTTNNGEKGTVTFADNKIKWNGTLVKDQVVTITYSVNAKVGTSNALRNVVVPTNPKGSCDDTVGCTTNHTFKPGTYTVKKAAAVQGKAGNAVLSNDVIDYTVTVRHTDGTKVTAATFTDDLTRVLDDAELVGAPVVTPNKGTANFDAATKSLTWTGDLVPGDVIKVTYSVRVNADGDLTAVNVVTPGGNGGSCEDGDQNCTTTHTIEKGKYTYAKSSTTPKVVKSGEKIDYTITVKHASGDRVKKASIKDDLTNVLANSAYNNDVKASKGAVEVKDGVLNWNGDLEIGDVVTITFSVTVDANGAAELVNVVTSIDPDKERHDCEEQVDQNCTTVHNVELGKYTFSKTADKPEKVTSGEKITYTLKVNHVSGDRVKAASIKDDFTGLLANATYNNDATLVSGPGAVAVKDNVLTWTGDLAPSEAVVITFSVTVDANGSAELLNAVISEDPVKERWSCAPEGCSTRHLVEGGTYNVAKASAVVKDGTPKDGTSVVAGEKLVYTLTVKHASGDRVKGASITDNFKKILTDGQATYNNDATASAGTVEVVDGLLTWNGDLAIGATVTITFSVDVNADTAVSLVNTVTPGDPRGTCTPAEVCVVTNEVPEGKYTYAKSSTPVNASVVQSGDKINYTITVKHTEGTRITGASIVDDLQNVLQNATYNDDAAATSGTVTVENGNLLKWDGDLAIGQIVTITFSVTVDADGDAELINAVKSLDDKPRHSCDDTVGCEVRHTVEKGKYTYSKTSTTPKAVKAGDKIDYTITVKHASGDRVKMASIKDDLSKVLAHATYNNDAKVVDGAGELMVKDGILTWNGDLAAGQTVTVTFSVTVNSKVKADLVNAVVSEDPIKDRHTCDVQVGCDTLHSVVPPKTPLPKTGVDALGLAAATVTLAGAGVLALVASRRRHS
ncbi:hypothetical protein NXS08_04785 [Gleimia sp. 6138-11-ORH1]|uniref:DUF7927 domain-containing protein n=1 Tax=Gleimia sp. 6138-11-ORH1 TaxID=2973937 RepID=UPI002168D921|nr:SdrD B-like domain-containing protein [Gleimia sp. 6138-11-ORH1]MCS4484792.1 hypothetical protein [Gleimia sp. 6138-11-ORH1]